MMMMMTMMIIQLRITNLAVNDQQSELMTSCLG
jgi:hypothetical protein